MTTNQQNREEWRERYHKLWPITSKMTGGDHLDRQTIEGFIEQEIESTRQSAAKEAREEVLMDAIKIVENAPFKGDLCMCCSKIKKELKQLTTN